MDRQIDNISTVLRPEYLVRKSFKTVLETILQSLFFEKISLVLIWDGTSFTPRIVNKG